MNKEGIEQLYREVYLKKLKQMTRILRGDVITAEDVVQETFYRALKYCHVYDEDKSTPEVWLNSIMYNVLWDFKKEENPESSSNKNLTKEDNVEYNKIQENPEFRALIVNKISLVKNEKHKKILRLFFLFGYSSKEISEMGIHITQTNVTTVVNRFKESLSI